MTEPWKVAKLVAWSNLAATLREPWRRATGWLALAAGLNGSLLGYLIMDSLAPAIVGAVLGAVVALLLVTALTLLIEPVACRRTDRVWMIMTPTGAACARVTANRTGEWVLTSMAARPLGRGVGDQLLEQVCSEADQQCRTVRLTASTSRVADWYRRHGFTPVPGRWRALRRLPAPPLSDEACPERPRSRAAGL